SLRSLTQPDDTYYGICQTVAGDNSTESTPGIDVCQYTNTSIHYWPPSLAFDNNVSTKYLNYGSGAQSASTETQGTGTGFYVSPKNGSSVLKGIVFATGDDQPNRDPIMCTVEGSNNASSFLVYGSSWTLIYSGSTGIPASPAPERSQYMSPISINNMIPYTAYRVLITQQSGSANGVQYSECHLLGY
ncbi:unnamed protein product, partial [Didymodactylos carnosus]